MYARSPSHHFSHISIFYFCVLKMKVVLDDNLHSALKDVDWMFWSSELFKVLGKCFLKHWIVTLHKLKLKGHWLLTGCWLQKKRIVSYTLNEAQICIIMFLLSSFCSFIPGIKRSRWACSIGKMLRDMTGKWQIAMYRSGSSTAEIWMCGKRGSRVTQVSLRSPWDETDISTWISFHPDSSENAETLSPGNTQQLFC